VASTLAFRQSGLRRGSHRAPRLFFVFLGPESDELDRSEPLSHSLETQRIPTAERRQIDAPLVPVAEARWLG
jgi:hypothetical protein